jgi:DNA-directed RNA polymerase specialized sigma24 family protein
MPAPAQQTKRASFEDRVDLVTESVDLYQTHLLHYVYKMTNQWQDAENIVQELWKFVMVYFKDEQIKHLPLLRRKAYQLFIDHYREKQRKPAIPTDQLPEHRSLKTAPEAYTDSEELRLKAVFFGNCSGLFVSLHDWWLCAQNIGVSLTALKSASNTETACFLAVET